MSPRSSTARPAQVLGRYVGRSPHEPSARRGGIEAVAERLRPLAVQRPGEAEVEDLHPPVGGEDHVRGLEVTVDQPLPVGFGEGIADLGTDPDDGRRGHRPETHPLGQGLAPDVLHDDEGGVCRLEDVVDGGDARVVERRDGAGLVEEATAALGDLRPGRGQALERDPAPQPLVLGEVDIPHAARAQLAQHPVRTHGARGHFASLRLAETGRRVAPPLALRKPAPPVGDGVGPVSNPPHAIRLARPPPRRRRLARRLPGRLAAPVGAQGGPLPWALGPWYGPRRLHAREPRHESPSRPGLGDLLQRHPRAVRGQHQGRGHDRERHRGPLADRARRVLPGASSGPERGDRVPDPPPDQQQLRSRGAVHRLRRGPGERAPARLRRGALRAPAPAGPGPPRHHAGGAVRARLGRARPPPRGPASRLPHPRLARDGGREA